MAAGSTPSKTGPETPVLVERSGPVTFIAINRPSKRNCVNLETAHALYSAFHEFDQDPQASVAVFYGKGGVFCAGYDLSSLDKTLKTYNKSATSSDRQEKPDNVGAGSRASQSPQSSELERALGKLHDLFHPSKGEFALMGPSRVRLRKPVIAAVEGYAVAGGLELSLLADLRVADEHAIFGVFCRRFGVPLIDGGTVRLPAIVGLGRALDLILTGRPVDAKEAHQMGLANRVVSVGTAVGEAHRLALEIAKFPQRCMRADRASAYYSTFDAHSFEDAIQFEYNGGRDPLLYEAPYGASSFVSDQVGRHGNFSRRSQPQKGQKYSDEDLESS